MKYHCRWGRLAVALVAASFCLIMPWLATAEESVIADWENPGTFPFEGTFVSGSELLQSDTYQLYAGTLTHDQFARAVDQYERGLGEVRYLQDGDILQVSFTVNGQHRAKTLRVKFGDDVPPDDSMRRALVYDTGRPDGLKLVRPDVCGNWSLMTIREETPVVVKEPPEPTKAEFRCWLEQRHSHGPDGGIVFLPGVVLNDCNERHLLPGYLIETTGLTSQGRGEVCDWVNR